MSTQVFGRYDEVMEALTRELRPTFERDGKSIFVMKVLGPALSRACTVTLPRRSHSRPSTAWRWPPASRTPCSPRAAIRLCWIAGAVSSACAAILSALEPAADAGRPAGLLRRHVGLWLVELDAALAAKASCRSASGPGAGTWAPPGRVIFLSLGERVLACAPGRGRVAAARFADARGSACSRPGSPRAPSSRTGSTGS